MFTNSRILQEGLKDLAVVLSAGLLRRRITAGLRGKGTCENPHPHGSARIFGIGLLTLCRKAHRPPFGKPDEDKSSQAVRCCLHQKPFETRSRRFLPPCRQSPSPATPPQAVHEGVCEEAFAEAAGSPTRESGRGKPRGADALSGNVGEGFHARSPRLGRR